MPAGPGPAPDPMGPPCSVRSEPTDFGNACYGPSRHARTESQGFVMTFAPVAPPTYFEPTKIAADTWVVHQVQPALGQPLFVYLNSMVILGAEPMIVDTGTPANREQWLKDVFALVEPKDVRWVFLSHDDVDHTGNLDEVMAACPNAVARLQLGHGRAAHELLRLPAPSLSMGDGRGIPRHR